MSVEDKLADYEQLIKSLRDSLREITGTTDGDDCQETAHCALREIEAVEIKYPELAEGNLNRNMR